MPPPFARAGHLTPCLASPTRNFPEKTWLERLCPPKLPQSRATGLGTARHASRKAHPSTLPRKAASMAGVLCCLVSRLETLDKASSRAKDGTCSSCDDIVAAREHKKCKARTPTFDTPYSTCLFQLLLLKRQERKHNEHRKLQQHEFNLGNGALFQMFETTNLLRLP